jgi:Rod binding domain-containing protein
LSTEALVSKPARASVRLWHAVRIFRIGDRMTGITNNLSVTAFSAARDLAGAHAASERELATEQARNWVGMTFFGALLKQMRSSPFKTDVLSGGRGEEVFAAQLDQVLSQRMARGAGSDLVDSLVKSLMGPQRTENSTLLRSARPPVTSPTFDTKTHVSTDLRA